MGHGLNSSALVIADAGQSAGLGHLSRSTAVAVALQTRGFQIGCHALGAVSPLVIDGLEWTPAESLIDITRMHASVLLLDSYVLRASDVRAVLEPRSLIVMHDAAGYPEEADLVIALCPSDNQPPGLLVGPRYACLRPEYWGLPARDPATETSVVLVAAGAAGGGLSTLMDAAQQAMPHATLRVVRGPFDETLFDDAVETIENSKSLLRPLLAADLVVTAAGQTLLEAAATGAPSVGVALAENQRRQLDHLGSIGAVVPADVDNLVDRIRELGTSLSRRRAVAIAAQSAIDGFGALRAAFAIQEIAERAWP